MGIATRIARRFLFSPKSHSVINVISRVSMVAVGIPVAAMVILMAVFSGFDDLIRRMYRDFDPGLMVVPAAGAVFNVSDLDTDKIVALPGVAAASFVLEERALAEYRGRQRMVTVRGVDSLFGRVVPLERMLFARAGGSGASVATSSAIVGQGVAYDMGVRIGLDEPMTFYTPSRGAYSALMPQSAVRAVSMPVDAVFVLDADTDGEYVIVPLEGARELFDYGGMATGLAVGVHAEGDTKRVKNAIGDVAGEGFVVKDRFEQNESMYKIMKAEKWGIFAIGLAVLIIASFSIVGSLVMLMLDKRVGIGALRALGASTGMIRGVFVRQGMMIGAIGAGAGLLLGLAVCAVQQWFGVVPMPGASFLVDSYPVLVRWVDVGAICAAFVAVTYVITVLTVHNTIKSE